jgi:hypothetical protein
VEETEVAPPFDDEELLVHTSAELGKEQEMKLLDELDGCGGVHFGSDLIIPIIDKYVNNTYYNELVNVGRTVLTCNDGAISNRMAGSVPSTTRRRAGGAG